MRPDEPTNLRPEPDWPARMAAAWGEESAWYVGRVLAEFPETGIDSLVRRSWLDRAFDRWRSNAMAVQSQLRQPQIIADIARGGPDMTCVAEIRGPVLSAFELWHEPDLMATAKRLNVRALELGFYRVGRARPSPEDVERCRATVVLDDNGVGGGVTDRLRELGCPTVPFNGGARANLDQRFANKRAEAFFSLREMLQRDAIALPPDEMLAEELLATEFGENAAGKIQIIPKDDIRARLGRSPDRADVAAMAAWRVGGFHHRATTQTIYI